MKNLKPLLYFVYKVKVMDLRGNGAWKNVLLWRQIFSELDAGKVLMDVPLNEFVRTSINIASLIAFLIYRPVLQDALSCDDCGCK